MEGTQLHRAAREATGDEVGKTVTDYRQLHDESRGGDAKVRKEKYAELAKAYYDLATDFYEYGWGQSFHFAPRHKKESYETSLARYEMYLAHRLGLRPGMKVLDVGSGVGGPARTIARFSGAEVIGLNYNDYQIKRAKKHDVEQGLDRRISYVQCDFMKVPLESNAYDAAYQLEATCHAADLRGCYAEIGRLLKPGACFAGYEWCFTDRYDPGSKEHQEIKKGIEEGAGLPDVVTQAQVLAALRGAGYEVIDSFDAATTSDPDLPWYSPLMADYRTLNGFRRTPLGREVTHQLVRTLETLKLAPKGSSQVTTVLNLCADALVAGGKTGIFTPMFFYLARKR
jgi:sterol 24-C-methyltransferase